MSKFIPRKIKKACKNATLVYNNKCTLIKVICKVKRNTKWKREFVAYIVRQEGAKLKMIEEDAWLTFQEAVKRYRHEQFNPPVLERKGL